MEEWTIVLNDRPIKSFAINEGERVTIGRGKEADVVIDNTAISRVHAALEFFDGIYCLYDLKSTNGTTVNGEKVTDMLPISKKDDIQIGKFRLVPTAVSASELSSSYSADLDVADETVFVTPKQAKTDRKPRFVADREGPRLVVIKGNGVPEELSLKGKSSIKIGSGSSCDLIVKGWLVAAAQCYIIKREEKNLIVPQSSWAATRLNGLRIKEEKELHGGDIIGIRNTQIRFN